MGDFMPWNQLGEGGYNTAYADDSRAWVLKVSHRPTDVINPVRCVRLWNEINPPPPARLYTVKTGESLGGIELKDEIKAWICPYVEGPEASVDEISQAVIDIFNKTGRIVVDATAPRNFVRTEHGIVCVDADLALLLEQEEEKDLTGSGRRNSIVSFNDWKSRRCDYLVRHKGLFDQHTRCGYGKAVNTVKALLFIRAHRPDITNADFLKTNEDLTDRLASAYTEMSAKDKREAIESLEQELAKIRLPDLPHIKASCIAKLKQYISLRGSITENGEVKLSWVSRIFRNQDLTMSRIRDAQQLIKQLDNSTSLRGLNHLIVEARKKVPASRSILNSGFKATLGLCRMMVMAGQKNYSPEPPEPILRSKPFSAGA